MSVADIQAQMEAVVAEAGDDGLSDEQCTRYEELEGQLKRAQRSEQILRRNSAYSAMNPDEPLIVDGKSKDDTLDRAFVDYIRGTAGSPNYRNADISELETRAQQEGIGHAGGFLVPDGFRQKLVERLVGFGGIVRDVETITTATGNPIKWPTVDDSANLGEIVVEGGTFVSGAQIVFGTAELGAYSYATGGANSEGVRVSWELLQDSAFDWQALLSKLLGKRIRRMQAVHHVRGTGVGEPQGLITGKTGIEIAADGDGITYADLVNFIHSVDPEYREGGNCSWAFNDQSLKRIRQLKDADNRPLLQPAAQAGIAGAPGGELLLGYPVTIDQAFPDFVANDNSINWGVFGDLEAGYVNRRVRDIQLVVDPWTRAKNRETEFTAWARMDGVQQDTYAYVALTGEEA